jgi:hypothetical protein
LTAVNAESVQRAASTHTFGNDPGEAGMTADMAIAKAIDTITLVEGYDAARVFLEIVWRRHGKNVDKLEFVLGGMKWADGSPVDPTMWEDWLVAVEIARAGRT